MSAKTPISVLVASLTLAFIPIHSAQAADGNVAAAQTGTIEGRVQNEVTGRYLNNSRVTVQGTDLQVFTDESGRYRLGNVPSGTITLEVLYSGLEKKEISLRVPAGQSVIQDVNLAPRGSGIVQIDPFLVEASKVMDQETIANNEQRFSPNIKTVVSTGDLSEHAGSSIATFLQFVPGISANGSALSVRGFPDHLTNITQDGAATANAPLASDTRSVSTGMTMSLTNLARVEVTKVPTPSTGADTMAGSVNLVSRNAFESGQRKFSYTITISGLHNQIMDVVSLEKTFSSWADKKIYYAAPSFNFTYAHPVNKNFGYTVSGSYDMRRSADVSPIYTINVNSATFGSSPSAPMWNNYLHIYGGQITERAHIGATADWRVTPNSVLSIGLQMFVSSNHNGGYRAGFNTGTNATPTIAGGVPGSFGPDYTIGATGRGTVSFSQNTQVQFYKGVRPNLRYNFDNGNWRVELKTSLSSGNFRYRTLPKEGYIRNLTASNAATAPNPLPLRVEFHDIDTFEGPAKILVFDNSNQLVDTSSASFHNHTAITNATTLTRDTTDEVSTYNVDIRRTLGFSPFPAAVKVGGARKTQERDRWNELNKSHAYNGPNGNQSPAPFLTPPLRSIRNTAPHVLVSPYRAAEAWNKEPGLFYQTPAQIVATERERRTTSEVIEETADALYLQLEARIFKNRLNVLTGVRYERTASVGIGSLNTPDGVWQRNPNGTFVLNANRARVRRPEAGAAGSLQELDFIWHERATRSTRNYDGYYPSLHLTYNFTDKLQSRAAYAKTYGRPNFSFVIPRTAVSEFTNQAGDVTGGRLTVRNPGLRPWTADNYDLTTEYYTDQGGVFGANVFRKDVVDFFGSESRDATPEELREVGVTPAGEVWEIVTTNNVGNARINGLELNANQSLSVLDPWLGGWGSNLRVFANITKIKLQGDRTADFTGFLPTSANWGFHFARKRVGASLKWNHRSDRTTGALTNIGPNGVNFAPARTALDVMASFNWRPNLGFFINMRNVTQVEGWNGRKSDIYPEYAKVNNFSRSDGIATNLGIKGSF